MKLPEIILERIQICFEDIGPIVDLRMRLDHEVGKQFRSIRLSTRFHLKNMKYPRKKVGHAQAALSSQPGKRPPDQKKDERSPRHLLRTPILVFVDDNMAPGPIATAPLVYRSVLQINS